MSGRNTTSKIIAFIVIIALPIYYAVKISLNKRRLKEKNETEIIKDSNTNTSFTDHSTSNNEHPFNISDTISNTLEYTEPIKLIHNKKISFNGNNFNIKINCEIGVWGECNVELHKNGNKISSEDFYTWEGNIQDFKVENRFIYFASPIAGGTAGNSYIQYFCIDLQKEKIISVTYECPDGTENCAFEDLKPIKEDPEVYKFMMTNIRLPKPGDNYFEKK